MLGKRSCSHEHCQTISTALLNITFPSEMHRELRSIKYAMFWKGVEFGYFLNYAGLVVLKPHLPNELFNQYVLLFCAITALSSNVYKTKWKVAGQLLDEFVNDFETLYGERYISCNDHNLLHVVEEVEHMESLWSISTNILENYLQFLKRLLRSGWKNLEQAINRLHEMDELNMKYASTLCNNNYPTARCAKRSKTSQTQTANIFHSPCL